MKDTIVELKNEFVPLLCNKEIFYCSMDSDGHYWRTTSIKSFKVVYFDESWKKRTWVADPSVESDEYSILESLVSCLENAKIICTFHGTSSMIPYLSSKLKAYDLDLDLQCIEHIDLDPYLRPLYSLCHLPSRRMVDYMTFLGFSEGTYDEADAVSSMTNLFSYRNAVLNSAPGSASTYDNNLVIDAASPMPVQKQVNFNAGPFTIRFSDNRLLLISQIKDGTVKLFYDDISSYVYLPSEDQAVPKSIAERLPADRISKCTYDNCYTRVDPSVVISNEANIKTYFASSMTYIKRFLNIKELPHDLRQP